MRIVDTLRYLNLQNKINETENLDAISYHSSCLAEKEHKLSLSRKSLKVTSTHEKVDSDAFRKTEENMISTVIDKREIRALSDIYQLYTALIQELSSNSQEPALSPQGLLKKLLRKSTLLTKTVYKNRTFVHRHDLTLDEIYSKGFNQKTDLINQIKKVGYEIRKAIQEVDKRQLPKKNLLVSHVIQGECDIPQELNVLVQSIVNGPRETSNPSKETKVSSICSSIIYTMSNGHVKPSLCLSLGLVMKSLTGSRKCLNILNRMGFCISYTVAAELETELAYSCSSEERILPHGLIPCQNLRTHLAFDNFDRFVETSSGKDTLHDTVGIAYQNISELLTNNDVPRDFVDTVTNEANESEVGQRRRKFYSKFDSTIDPYVGGQQGQFRPMIECNLRIPDNWQKVTDLNCMWMFHHAFATDGSKRWFPWNSERCVDPNPMQRIGYLPNINSSPTSDAVVQKTLQIAQKIAIECNQENIIVTYDLGIAARAYKIQANMSPGFDNIFINMGGFHIQMSYFKVFSD